MNSISSKSLWQIAIEKFKRSKTGMLSFWYIILCGLTAIFCYVLAPDNSNSANQMHLEIHSKSPGFSVQMLSIPSEAEKKKSWFSVFINGKKNTATEISIQSYSIKNNQLEVIKYADGLPKEFPASYEKYIQQKTFYFGTDKYGRDLLSRLLIGARISFFIGFIAVFISLLIGIPIGAIAGYFGGKVDNFIMWPDDLRHPGAVGHRMRPA